MKKTRVIVRIDPDLCNGCGACVPSCAEGAIQIIDGKARLVAENLCDDLGACLGNCPLDAITLEEREADAFDEASVHEHLTRLGRHGTGERGAPHQAGAPHTEPAPAILPSCPSALARDLRLKAQASGRADRAAAAGPAATVSGLTEAVPTGERTEGLANWPIQLGLVNPGAGFLRQARLLIAADCTAFARPGLRSRLAGGRVTLIGCPKLDDAVSYIKKLAAILRNNDIRDIVLAVMEVPCCGGLAHLLRMAQREAGTSVPVTTQVVTIEGEMEEAV